MSLREGLVTQMRAIAEAAGVSTSSVAEVALRRLLAHKSQEEIVQMVVQEGGTARRHTRKTWLEAFYATLRDLVPEPLRQGGSGYEFMGYEVLPSAERSSDPDRIMVHTMEANLPIGRATAYDGMMFAATLDTAPAETAKAVFAWLRGRNG